MRTACREKSPAASLPVTILLTGAAATLWPENSRAGGFCHHCSQWRGSQVICAPSRVALCRARPLHALNTPLIRHLPPCILRDSVSALTQRTPQVRAAPSHRMWPWKPPGAHSGWFGAPHLAFSYVCRACAHRTTTVGDGPTVAVNAPALPPRRPQLSRSAQPGAAPGLPRPPGHCWELGPWSQLMHTSTRQ